MLMNILILYADADMSAVKIFVGRLLLPEGGIRSIRLGGRVTARFRDDLPPSQHKRMVSKNWALII